MLLVSGCKGVRVWCTQHCEQALPVCGLSELVMRLHLRESSVLVLGHDAPRGMRDDFW